MGLLGFIYTARPILTIRSPFHKREAENYTRPVASREYLLELINKQTAPVNAEYIVALLGYEHEDDIEGVRRRLQAMVRDGQLFRNRRGGYLGFEHMDLKKGRTVFLIGFLVLIVIWMIAFGSRIADLNRLTSEYDESQLTISALTATTGALATEADADLVLDKPFELTDLDREINNLLAKADA